MLDSARIASTRRKLSDRRKEIMMGVRTRQTSARWLMSLVFFLQGAPPAPPPPPNAKAAAPIDFTGQWVSVVTEDWRYRMITPPKGNYAGVPLNDAARKIADNWDPAKDEAAGAQCKAYGAANIMRVPARIRISWAHADAFVSFQRSPHSAGRLAGRVGSIVGDDQRAGLHVDHRGPRPPKPGIFQHPQGCHD